MTSDSAFSAMIVCIIVVCAMVSMWRTGGLCNGGPPSWTDGVILWCPPAIKLHSLAIPIHSQPFLHNDCTKVHSEKARPFFGEYCSKKYKMCRMYTDVQCFEQCWYNCETLRPQGLICIGLRSPSVVIEAISLNNDRISQYYNNSTTHPELQCFLRFLALRHTMRITHAL